MQLYKKVWSSECTGRRSLTVTLSFAAERRSTCRRCPHSTHTSLIFLFCLWNHRDALKLFLLFFWSLLWLAHLPFKNNGLKSSFFLSFFLLHLHLSFMTDGVNASFKPSPWLLFRREGGFNGRNQYWIRHYFVWILLIFFWLFQHFTPKWNQWISSYVAVFKQLKMV